MAKFRFNLEAVLEQRRAMEKERQREVAALERARLEIERELRGRQRAIEGAREDLRDALGKGEAGAAVMIDFGGVRLQSRAAFHQTQQAQMTAIRLAGAMRKVEAARARLLEAARARKAVEMLREKRYEEWRRDQERREAAAVDEINVMRAARRGEEVL